MTFRTSVILLLVSAGILGFDILENSHYLEAYIDEALLPQVDDEQSLAPKSRYTRDAHEENSVKDCCILQKTMESSCCGAYGVFRHTSAMREFMKECVLEIKSKQMKSYCQADLEMYRFPHSANGKVEQQICERECLGKKTNVLDAEGNILNSEMKSYIMKEKLQNVDQWPSGTPENIIDSCIQNVKEKEPSHIDNGKKVKCNPQAYYFERCIWRNMEINCLEDFKKKSPDCEKRRHTLSMEEKRWQHITNATT